MFMTKMAADASAPTTTSADKPKWTTTQTVIAIAILLLSIYLLVKAVGKARKSTGDRVIHTSLAIVSPVLYLISSFIVGV